MEGSANQRPLAFVLPNIRGGGAERVALYLIQRLLDLGHRVDLVLMEATGELLGLVPPEVRVIDLKARRVRHAIAPLARYLKREKPSAMQVRLWPLTVAAVIAKLLARSDTRLILSDHMQLSAQYGDSPVKMFALKWSTRLFYPLAETRLVVSRGAADDLARVSGLSRDSFEVIYNPAARINAEPPQDADAIWGRDGARIVSIGTLKPQKNHKLLVRSFARLRRRRPAKLMIIGDGVLWQEVVEEAERLRVTDDLLLPGFIREPAGLLSSADLFVLSSDYEGFGNVLIEAMRQGVPVVSTDCPSGPAEIVDGGRYGRLVPCGDEQALADAMEASLDDHPSPEVLKARAEEISGDAPVRRYVELLTGQAAARDKTH